MHECVRVSPTHPEKQKGTLMDSGKILIGIALVMFSAALMVTPSSAAGSDVSPGVGNGNAVTITGTLMSNLPQSAGADGTPVLSPVHAAAGTSEDR